MSASAFSFVANNPLVSQPNSGGEKLIARSNNAADTGNLTTVGLVSGTSTAETKALTGKREVLFANTVTTLSLAKLSASQAGTVSIYGQGTAAAGSIRVDTLPANNDTLLVGLTGFQQTYTFKTTHTGAANEIKIAASINAQATNIYEAINAGANAGTDYGTGTAANAYVVASAPSGAALVITDRIAVSRSLAWVISQGTGATLSIVSPTGGVTGTLLASLSPGIISSFNSFTLSTEDLTTATLPALFTGSSSALQIGKSACALRFKCDGAGSAIAIGYDTSTDGSNWANGLTAITDVDDSYDIPDPQHVVLDEGPIQYIRLNIETNANSSDVKLDARAIS